MIWQVDIGTFLIVQPAPAIEENKDCLRLAGTAPVRAWHLLQRAASFLPRCKGGEAQFASYMIQVYKLNSYVFSMHGNLLFLSLYSTGKDSGYHNRCINFTALSLTLFMTLSAYTLPSHPIKTLLTLQHQDLRTTRKPSVSTNCT